MHRERECGTFNLCCRQSSRPASCEKRFSKAVKPYLPADPILPWGCVLVRDGDIIARGHTQPPYQHHAEPMALSQIEGDLSDVVAFVTLEPCSFHNRTPSCAKQMVERGITNVVIAMRDPHPRNRGAGVQLLLDAGVTVIEDVLRGRSPPGLGYFGVAGRGRACSQSG